MILTGEEIDMTPGWDEPCGLTLTEKALWELDNPLVIYTES